MNSAKGLFYTTVEGGARNQLWGATAKRGEGKGLVKSGEYYTPIGVPGNGSWQSQDMALAGKLWDWTEKELDDYKL